MKKFFVFLFFILMNCFKTYAQDFQIDENLLKSFKNCESRQENIPYDSPFLKILGPMFDKMKLKIKIDIKNKDVEGLCLIDILIGFKDFPGGTGYSCKVSDEERQNLIDAWNDKSNEQIIEKFKQKFTVEQADGSETTHFTDLEIIGTKKEVYWQKMLASSCERRAIKPSEEELKVMQKKMMTFSPEFIENLKKCNPAEDDKSVVMMSMKTVIVGKENGKCHIALKPFDLYLDDEQLSKTTRIDQLYEYVDLGENTKYTPDYQISGLLMGLHHCQKGENKKYDAGKSSMKIGERIQIQAGIQTKVVEKDCEVRFGNVLSVGEQKKGYGKKCLIPLAKINDILEPYKDELPKEGEFSMKLNTETNKKLYDSLISQSFCK